MSLINYCPVCATRLAAPFLTRRSVPVHQNLVVRDRAAAVALQRGDLTLACCTTCGFITNTSFELDKLSYGADYDNNQVCSPFFSDYLDTLITKLIEKHGVRNSHIIDVGCGNGLFLKRLVAAAGANNTGTGYDPSYVGPDSDLDGRLHFERRFYGPDCADVAADVVVCRHVIEHVPQPLQLLGAIRQALAASPQARVFFETPCVEWILRNQVVWDVFYEHCSYWTASSLTTAFELSGFAVDSVQHVFGGQYLWLEARISNQQSASHLIANELPDLATHFATNERQLVEAWQIQIQALTYEGGVALWGAGAKGATLATLIDPRCVLIACVVDLNPNKQGRFIPGTGHPIVDYQQLDQLGVRNAVLMNPNYLQENLALLHAAGLHVSLIQLETSS